MEEDNYISINWKYFIAIVSVSTLKCEYLQKHLEELFLQTGGDIEWLIGGIKKVPEKLQTLGKLINILAHQPWRLSLFDFNDLLSKSDNSSSWNLNELVLAFMIIITYQKIAAIVKSVGIKIKLEEPMDIYKIMIGNGYNI